LGTDEKFWEKDENFPTYYAIDKSEKALENLKKEEKMREKVKK